MMYLHGPFSNLFRISTFSSRVHLCSLLRGAWPVRITSMDQVKPLLELADFEISKVRSEDNDIPMDCHNNPDECERVKVEPNPPEEIMSCQTVDPGYSTQHLVEEVSDAKGETDFRFRMQFHLPNPVRKFLRKEQTQLMREMHTKIVVPIKKKKGNIVITGCTKTNVEATYMKMQELIANRPKKLPPTHFVSIPMNTPNIRERFEIFKNQVLECYGSDEENIVEELFTPPAKLHLTLFAMTSSEETEIVIASRKLDECREKIIEPLLHDLPIVVRMRGIEIMNTDPTKAAVLYAKVESAGDVLQKLADEVATFYAHNCTEAKIQHRTLVKCEKKEIYRIYVKLHVTLMNIRFLKQKEKSLNKPKLRRSLKFGFNATDILKDFKDFDFGVVTVNSMHLSQMRSLSKDEYYISSNIIQWA